MANKFAGFKPETLTKKILPALGYDGPTDEKSINAFLAASPAAAAKMGKYTMLARQMVEGKPIRGMAPGGDVRDKLGIGKKTPAQVSREVHGNASPYSKAEKRYSIPGGTLRERHDAAMAGEISVADVVRGGESPGDDKKGGVDGSTTPIDTNTTVTGTGTEDSTATDTTNTTTTEQQPTNPNLTMPSGSAATRQLTQDGGAQGAAYKPGTADITDDMIAGGQINPEIGQAGDTTQAQQTMAEQTGVAAMPDSLQAPTVDATKSAGAVADAARQSKAAQGTVSSQAQMTAAQMDPNQAASLGLDAAQLGQAQTVDAPDAMQVTQDQLVSGSAVDQKQVEETLALSEAASVADELGDLMQDFDGGDTPAWAAGAMRAANAAMAARGLSSSSMAGMAVVQAAMESALPIAQMDAANKQQMAMAKAEQRAKFMGMEFDQNFQTKVKNAARISEIANINFSAEQQVALENARLAQTVDLANLSNKQAKVMADAATMSQIDMANLDNRQQAAKQQADAFLAMDFKNLDNEQENSMFQSQAIVQSMFTDAAADNAAKQFNATSQAQTDQFFASLSTQVEQFNAEQSNAMSRFNAGEANALEQFNAAQDNLRDQFNATNHLVVAQANTQWFQNLTTADNAAINQANRDEALAANNLTMTAYNNMVQRERDILAWAWQSGENQSERQNNIAIAKITGGKDADGTSSLLGKIAGKLVDNAANIIFDGITDFNPFSAVSS